MSAAQQIESRFEPSTRRVTPSGQSGPSTPYGQGSIQQQVSKSRSLEEAHAIVKSHEFYTQTGFPQYAGKYAAPNMPPGAIITDIKEQDVRSPTSPLASSKQLIFAYTLPPREGSNVAHDDLELEWARRKDALTNAPGIAGPGFAEQSLQMKRDPFGYAISTGTRVAGAIAFVVAPQIAISGALISVPISQGVKAGFGGGWLTSEEVKQSFWSGAAFSVGSAGVMSGIRGVAPKIVEGVGQGLTKTATGALGRAGVNASLGAGTSALLSGGNPTETVKGAAFGAAFSVVSDVVFTPIARHIAGYRIKRVVGAEEIELSRATDTGITSERLTTVRTETERAPYKYGKFIKENQRFFTPTEADFSGRETVAMRGGGELDVYPEQQYSSFSRPAEPYIHAAKGESSVRIEQFAYSGGTATREMLTTSKASGQVYQKTTVTKPGGFIAAETTVATRTLSTVQFFGEVDRQIYLKFLKTMPKEVQQSWLTQMGGLSYEQIVKPEIPTKIKVFTNIISVQPSNAAASSIIPVAIPFSATSVASETIKNPQDFKAKATAIQPESLPRSKTRLTPTLTQPEMQGTYVVPKQDQFSFQTLSQTPEIEAKTTPEAKTIEQQISTISISAIPTGTRHHFTSVGFKFEGDSSSSEPALRFTGVRSRKRKYPILSGEDVLRIGKVRKKHK